MFGIEKLLERYRNSLDKDSSFKKVVIEVIQESLGFSLKPNEISLSGDVLRIQTSPTKRSEINLHEQELLQKICLKTGTNIRKILY